MAKEKRKTVKRKSVEGELILSVNDKDSNGRRNISGGLNEIEALFTKKKKAKVESKEEMTQRRTAKKRYETCLDSSTSQSWIDDGLGGKFNTEGYTGRTQDGCRIFKAHVLSKPNAGNTKDCPFDCDCCFI